MGFPDAGCQFPGQALHSHPNSHPTQQTLTECQGLGQKGHSWLAGRYNRTQMAKTAPQCCGAHGEGWQGRHGGLPGGGGSELWLGR